MNERSKRKEVGWGKLDNTANLFPAIANETMTNVYRMSVTLTEKICPDCLQQALEQVLPWFENMNVRMRTGMFWYYFETNIKGMPVVKEEDDFPCRYMEPRENRYYLFRVTWYGSRINLEVFHVLADGSGAVNFLRELTYQYLRLKYPEELSGHGDHLSDDTSLNTEDGYLRYYHKRDRKSYRAVPAVHIRGERLARGELGVIHGYLSVSAVKQKARELSMSINEYLCGIYVYSIYKACLHENPSKKPVVLCVPVNLRPFFASLTTRNFFAMISVPFLAEKEHYERPEIMGMVRDELKKRITREHLEQLISYNVSNQKNLALRAVPLFLKKPVMKLVYLSGVRGTTTTMTNVGMLTVEEEYRAYIRRFQVILSPSEGQNIKATACSCGDELTVTFGSLLKDTAVQKEFFRCLSEEGLKVTIETNGVYDELTDIRKEKPTAESAGKRKNRDEQM